MSFNNLLPHLPLVFCMALTGSPALAQTIYRSVDADGRVVFSDKPPIIAKKTQAIDSAQPTFNVGPALPFALQQVVDQYPVTLYTTKDCAPCDSGRNWLQRHSIPFTEKTVNTNEDIAALQRLSGQVSMPFLTVGLQHLKGYSESEWTQYIHAAGYPDSSQLPTGYRTPPATPLVAIAKPASPQEASNAAPKPVQPPPHVNTDNPTGIQF